MTPPTNGRNIHSVESDDVAGQSWGINPDFGGMKIFETLRRVEPDFFFHSGDSVYAFESPWIGVGCGEVLAAGMCLAEGGSRRPELAVRQYEDNVLITHTGVEVLTSA